MNSQGDNNFEIYVVIIKIPMTEFYHLINSEAHGLL